MAILSREPQAAGEVTMKILANQLRVGAAGIVAVVLLASVSVGRATTVVVARSASEIVIGADSKVTDTYGKELSSQVCKIQQVGNLFVAFEGLLRDKATGFNIPEITLRP